MTTLAIVPASGAITAARTVCRVTISGAADNTLTGYDGSLDNTPTGQHQYPSSPAETYHLEFVLGGVVQGKSYVFTPGPDGGHVFNNYIFPTAGSWTINLIRTRGTYTDATLAVTVA